MRNKIEGNKIEEEKIEKKNKVEILRIKKIGILRIVEDKGIVEENIEIEEFR